MSPALADLVNAQELAGRAAAVERSFNLRQLARVAEAGGLDGTEVRAVLRFEIFEGRPTVEIELEGVAVLECQRCLKPCACSLRESERVIVVANDTDEVAGGYEPFIGDAESLSLSALVEEQVLLALPLVPMHDDPAQCRKSARGKRVAKVEAEAQPEDVQRPFANLRDLLEQDEQ
jgi:uncharacterized protein